MRSQSLLLQEIIHYYSDRPDTIQHILKAHSLSILISDLEGLSEEEQQIIGAAALLHELAHQEDQIETDPLAAPVPDMARAILAKLSYDPPVIDIICALAQNHWQLPDPDNLSLQCLIEASRLAHYYDIKASAKAIADDYQVYFRTETGSSLCRSMFSQAFAETDS